MTAPQHGDDGMAHPLGKKRLRKPIPEDHDHEPCGCNVIHDDVSSSMKNSDNSLMALLMHLLLSS